MTWLLTTAQMRALESAAIASGHTTARALMEVAGRGAAQLILSRWPGARHARVLVGPGNNGGDGYVIARHLAQAGWRVEVAAFAAPTGTAASAAAADCPVIADDWAEAAVRANPGMIVVDALFGTGLTRPLPASAFAVVASLARSAGPMVAVDIASGLCADSGRVLGGLDLPGAALTVTFQAVRPGHVLDRGGLISGAVEVVDLGLGTDAPADTGPQARLVTGPADLLKGQGHKYDHGHVLVLAGPPARGGAARLAARAALRIGAGLVTIGAQRDALPENAARLDAVMLREVGTAGDLTATLEDRRIGTVLLGPGLGRDRAPSLVAAAAAQGRALVLDGDALLPDLPELPPRSLLTPHDGEFARLAPDLAARLAGPACDGPACSRLDAVRAAARRLGATILLKGPDTVIAAPDGRSAIHAARGRRAVPWLATAGAGDVLAGLAAGLIARGHDPFEAACAAAWLHVEAALHVGPGLIAEDLPEAIPAILRTL